MKTEGLKQALDKYGFDAAFGGARRDEEKSRAKERIFSFRTAQHRWDPKNQRPELWRLYNARHRKRRVAPRLPALELDRARRLALHPPRGDPDRAALLRGGAAGRRARRDVDHGRRRPDAARAGRGAAAEARPLPDARLLPALGRDRVGGRHAAEDHPGDAARADVRAAGPADRPRRRPPRWRRRRSRATSE